MVGFVVVVDIFVVLVVVLVVVLEVIIVVVKVLVVVFVVVVEVIVPKNVFDRQLAQLHLRKPSSDSNGV